MVAAVGYLHSEATERWDFFIQHYYSTHCNIDTKLNQHYKKWWQRWDIFILSELRDEICYTTLLVHTQN